MARSVGGLAVAVLVVGGVAAWTLADPGTREPTRRECRADPSLSGCEERKGPQRKTRRCVDVTSHDHNWDNDMLCTRIDGSTFHTSYDGAEAFLAR